MIEVGRISRYLTIAFVSAFITVQAIFVSTAVFAENREIEQFKEVKQIEHVSIETAKYQDIRKMNLNRIANEYGVEPDYLYQITEIEQQFNLQPYELVALIAQESGFKPKTQMDGGSLSYSTTQMKLPSAQTAYMAITEYYKIQIPYPTHDLLASDTYYATLLAGGYLRYLHDVYENKYEAYTAYRYGIGGRLSYYERYGDFRSSYALKIEELTHSYVQRELTI